MDRQVTEKAWSVVCILAIIGSSNLTLFSGVGRLILQGSLLWNFEIIGNVTSALSVEVEQFETLFKLPVSYQCAARIHFAILRLSPIEKGDRLCQ